MAHHDVIDAADAADNRNIILNPLRQMKASLEGGNAYDEVKAALKTFIEAHEECLGADVGDGPEPWPEYTAVQFGVGDNVDKKVDELLHLFLTLTQNNVAASRQRAIAIATEIIPAIEAGPGAANGDVEMAMGGKKRRGSKKSKKTKKAAKKSKKASKKARRITRRR